MNLIKSISTNLGINFLMNQLIRIFKIPTSIVLILVNIIPIFGVILFDWNPFDLLIIYWFENIIIGFFNYFRILKAEGNGSFGSKITLNGQNIEMMSKSSIASFFMLHYGLFTFVHGIFVIVLFASRSSLLSISNIFLGIGFIISIIVSHGISFFYNFLYKQEYRYISADTLFIQPYKRVIPIHVTIIFGAMLLSQGESSIFISLIFAAIKIIIDLWLHVSSHAKFQLDIK